MKPRRHGHRSLFVKLLVVSALTALFVNGAVLHRLRAFFGASPGVREEVLRHGARYLDSLIAEMGSPPRQDRASALGQELGVGIRVSGPGVELESRPGLPPGKVVDRSLRGGAPGLRWGRTGGLPFVRREKGGSHYDFFFNGRGIAEMHWAFQWEGAIFLLLILTVIVGLAWAAIRWMLMPLRALEAGVDRIAEGDFAHRVPNCRRDELGHLAESFNRMAERIGAMMASREQLLLDVSHELRSPSRGSDSASSYYRRATSARA